MKTPVVLVAVTLAVAILLAASLLIATGTRGESARGPLTDRPAGWTDATGCEVIKALPPRYCEER